MLLFTLLKQKCNLTWVRLVRLILCWSDAETADNPMDITRASLSISATHRVHDHKVAWVRGQLGAWAFVHDHAWGALLYGEGLHMRMVRGCIFLGISHMTSQPLIKAPRPHLSFTLYNCKSTNLHGHTSAPAQPRPVPCWLPLWAGLFGK